MKSKKEVYGSIRFSYDTLVMPLEVAHKVQALLAEHAVKVDTIYSTGVNPTVNAIRPWDMSAVEVVQGRAYDCTHMKSEDYKEWSSAVRERDEGEAIMSPFDFIAMRREQ